MARSATKIFDAIGTLVRLGLAGVWLWAGAGKVADPNQFVKSVEAYQLFPNDIAGIIGAVVPFVEVALGLLLLFGVGTRFVAILSGLLMLAYIGGIVQSWARGLSIDCGCFSAGGQVAPGDTHYLTDILRDTGFEVMAVWLVARPRSWLSVDGWLGRRHTPPAAPDDGNLEAENAGDLAGDPNQHIDGETRPSTVGRA